MSRSFTMSVEGLGTKLEWDCGSGVASSVYPNIVQALHKECKANEEAGHGSCGFVSHKLEGLQAYSTVRMLAVQMFADGSIGKATLLQEFAKVYADALLRACGNYKAPLSYEMRGEVEVLLEGAQVQHVPSLDDYLAELLREQAWLLNVKLEASR